MLVMFICYTVEHRNFMHYVVSSNSITKMPNWYMTLVPRFEKGKYYFIGISDRSFPVTDNTIYGRKCLK